MVCGVVCVFACALLQPLWTTTTTKQPIWVASSSHLIRFVLTAEWQIYIIYLGSITFGMDTAEHLSIIGGVVAGILGFTSLKGFEFYFLLMSVTSPGLVAKAKFSNHSCFDSWN